ncbi:MAG: HelD family protein [Bacillota bacterium]
MANDPHGMEEENAYLEDTLALIRDELDMGTRVLPGMQSRLIALRRDMWDNTAHFVEDAGSLTEINHYMMEVTNQSSLINRTLKQMDSYKRLLNSPYFGRFDFFEDGSGDREKIYIGLNNVIDSKTHDIFIYDWRAPIASVYYRHELGAASFIAPMGKIAGRVALKRQYKIQCSQLQYYFDCSMIINDEILQEVLGRNASPKMKNIAVTIQKEQDLIIRDTQHDVLFVQGVAGSGKTSVALHRIAFLLYNGIKSGINSGNMLIVSPNSVFIKYISSVLPELGEENARQTTFDELVQQLLGGKLKAETRNMHLESLITFQISPETLIKKQSTKFKGSRVFMEILNRLIEHYERRVIAFEDIYYAGRILVTRQQLKNHLLDNKTGMPLARRLKRMQNKILTQVHRLRRDKLEIIERIVQQSEGHDLEIRSFSRLLSIRQTRPFRRRLHQITQVSYAQLYKMLFDDRRLFLKLAQGLALPHHLDQIISTTKANLEKGLINYEDCASLLYLKLSIEGCDSFSEVRHVVIDEAQDYHPLQYAIFKLLFHDAKYTVLGDMDQAVEKSNRSFLEDGIADILGKGKPVYFNLHQSYRSSYEINAFAQKLPEDKQKFTSFERHGAEPTLVYKSSQETVDRAVAEDLAQFLEQGYTSVAVICKTAAEAKKLSTRLKKLICFKLCDINDDEFPLGAVVIPAYMAKGLEFDAVLVYGVSKKNYFSDLDRRLLYIACTRALHRLALYYTGEISPFITQGEISAGDNF